MRLFWRKTAAVTPKTAAILTGIVGVYVALVLGNITRWSIWFDEAFSAYLTRYSYAELTAYTAADVHPPFYYWLLKAWVDLFGTSELAFRSLSMFFGALAIIAMFVLVRRVFRSNTWALVASGVMAITPILIRFGDEARMYTLVLLVVLVATYALVRATEKNASRWWWALYGMLLAIGMLTHYFVALAWLAHWVWRYLETRRGAIKAFWSKEWIVAHIGAVLLFGWWLPIAVKQFVSVQQGFWIPGLSAYTPIDYTSNATLYRQYGEVAGWWAVLYAVGVAVSVYVLLRGYRYIKKESSMGANLFAAMAVVPPVLLMVISLPPLRSTFIDRYVLYAQVFGLVVIALSLWILLRRTKSSRWLKGMAATLGVLLLLGIGNVYYYGNYNKNSGTSIRVSEVMQQIESAGKAGQPVITATPWIYYEAAFYENDAHAVYFLDSTAEGYGYGSLAMLKENDAKIIDLDTFAADHRYVWFLGSEVDREVDPPVDTWKRVENVGAYDYIDNNTKYRASLFDTRP